MRTLRLAAGLAALALVATAFAGTATALRVNWDRECTGLYGQDPYLCVGGADSGRCVGVRTWDQCVGVYHIGTFVRCVGVYFLHADSCNLVL